MNNKAIVLIFTIILVSIAGGCADKSSSVNNGPGFKVVYSLVPQYLSVLNKMPEHHDVHPAIRDEKEEFNNILLEADVISEDIDSKILIFEEEGKDVQRLKSLLEEYKALIASARTYRELADYGHDNCSDPDCQAMDKDLYLQLSRESLKQSNSVLSKIFDEMKKMLPGHVELDNNCTLSAIGNGRVLLAGDLNVSFSARNGVLYMISFPQYPEYSFNIVGKYEYQESQKGEDHLSYYKLIDTKVDISAQRSAFIIEANEISIDVNGTGTVDFFGNGTYTITCKDNSSSKMQWQLPTTTVRRTINSPYIYTGVQ
ncbi:hypothetical protein [uncultured Methanomethylovorans sp.]|uniref:hypothetical protein n=1 Tax=uncultured Methanomethylovorans sp. TaxID=183759 RepID=UPI002AA6ED4C|nr:hypothetical protein [uncultured Methanomethylovorans sp.]